MSLSATLKLVFSELVRQISVHCVERGVVLTRVWNLTLALMAMDRPLEVDPRKFTDAQAFLAKLEAENGRLNEICVTYRAKLVSLAEEIREMRNRYLKWEEVVNARAENIRQENLWLKSVLQRFADLNRTFLPPPVPPKPGSQREIADTHRFSGTHLEHAKDWATSHDEFLHYDSLADTFLSFFRDTSDFNIFYKMRRKVTDVSTQTPKQSFADTLEEAVLGEEGRGIRTLVEREARAGGKIVEGHLHHGSGGAAQAAAAHAPAPGTGGAAGSAAMARPTRQASAPLLRKATSFRDTLALATNPVEVLDRPNSPVSPRHHAENNRDLQILRREDSHELFSLEPFERSGSLTP